MKVDFKDNGFVFFNCESKKEDRFMDKWFDNNVMCRAISAIYKDKLKDSHKLILQGKDSNSKVLIIFSEDLKEPAA